MTEIETVRTAENRLKNWTGTVHYAIDGRPACGPLQTHESYLAPSVATVTCARCIAKLGADEPGHVDPPIVQEHVARRAAERAERRDSDHCESCGSTSLFSGWFDADDLGYQLALGDPTPPGVRWTTFCNECGAEQTSRRAKEGSRA